MRELFDIFDSSHPGAGMDSGFYESLSKDGNFRSEYQKSLVALALSDLCCGEGDNSTEMNQ